MRSDTLWILVNRSALLYEHVTAVKVWSLLFFFHRVTAFCLLVATHVALHGAGQPVTSYRNNRFVLTLFATAHRIELNTAAAVIASRGKTVPSKRYYVALGLTVVQFCY